MKKLLFFIFILIIFHNFSYTRTRRLTKNVDFKSYTISTFKIFSRKTVWIGNARSYGAPTIKLIVDFINDCHYRMRFSYYLGVSPKNVLFGTYKRLGNYWVLRDGDGNVINMTLRGWTLAGDDNGYRIRLRRIR